MSQLLREAHSLTFPSNPARNCIPVIDDTLFQDIPTTLMVKGRISDVPILMGATTDESLTQSDDLKSGMEFWYPALSTRGLTALSKLYSDSDFLSRQDALSAAVGQTLLRRGSETLVDMITKTGKPSYIYRFDQPNPTIDPLVHHSAENWWMLQGSNTGSNGTYAPTPFKNASQKRFSKDLVAYRISFVQTGHPSALRLLGSPEWPMWSNANRKTQRGRIVLKQGTGVEDRGGSFVATGYLKEVERCHATNSLAWKLRF